MQNPTLVVLTERRPHEVQMLKEIYSLSVRDYEVLKLCADGPLCPRQCTKSLLACVKSLESRGFLTWVSFKHWWVASELAYAVLVSIPHLIHAYTPLPRKSKAKVLPFSNALELVEHNGSPAS
jgi:hypothetical protein